MSQKSQEFIKELQSLLGKYNAEIDIVDIGGGYYPTQKIEVSFIDAVGDFVFMGMQHDWHDIEPN